MIKGKGYIFQAEVILMFSFMFTLALKAYAGATLPLGLVLAPVVILGTWRALLLFYVVCAKEIKKINDKV